MLIGFWDSLFLKKVFEVGIFEVGCLIFRPSLNPLSLSHITNMHQPTF
jgi:hypothetical protein